MGLHQTIYNKKPEHGYFAPGRLNLLGTHTSNSGGYTLSIPTDRGVRVFLSMRDDDTINIYSEQFHNEGVQPLNENILFHQRLLEVIRKPNHESYKVTKGFDVTISSNLPMGIGFSSSAALIVAFMGALIDLHDYEMPKDRFLRFANFVDKKISSIPLSFSHQITAIYGQKDHANFIFCQNLDLKETLFDFSQYKLIVFNTNQHPENLAFTIKQRYAEIHEGTKIITRHRPIDTLCEIDFTSFSELRSRLSNQEMVKRIEHVIFENDRTLSGYDALLIHEYPLLGDLMNQSQSALEELFDMSTAEINYVVSNVRGLGALGVRMIGPGKGGAIVALFDEALVPDFNDIQMAYEKRFKKPLDVYEVKSASGFHKFL